jgi:hypothetical protein
MQENDSIALFLLEHWLDGKILCIVIVHLPLHPAKISEGRAGSFSQKHVKHR